MDGTLIDTYQHQKSHSRKSGMVERRVLRLMRKKHINSVKDGLNYISNHALLKHFDQPIRNKVERTLVRMYKDIPMKKGVLEYLNYLQSQGMKMALCTNNHSQYALLALESLGIRSYFDVIISGEDVNELKPNPQIFKLAMDYFQVSASEMIIFEDMLDGVLAGKALEIKVIAVKEEYYVHEYDAIEKAVEYVIEDFSDPRLYNILT